MFQVFYRYPGAYVLFFSDGDTGNMAPQLTKDGRNPFGNSVPKKSKEAVNKQQDAVFQAKINHQIYYVLHPHILHPDISFVDISPALYFYRSDWLLKNT